MALQTPYTNEQMLRLLSLAHRSSRKNLLKNWYFPRPANRRGKTSYTGSVQFTIDWWKTNFSGIKVDLEDTGVKVSAASALTSAGWTLYQPIGNVSNLVGKNLTLALAVASRSTDNFVAVISYRNAADSEITATTVNVKSDGMVSVTGIVPTGTEGLRVGLYIRSNALSAGDYITLIAAKLELGTEQSLAYQDATGAWHLTEEPTEEEQRLWGLLPRLSNPNLLDNWYFADPINQRGQTEHTASNIYFIDQWLLLRLTSDDTGYSAKIANGGIKLTGGSNYAFFMSSIEANVFNGLRGKAVTLSAMIDGVVYSSSVMIPTTAFGVQTTLMNATASSISAIQLVELANGNLRTQLRVSKNSSILLQAVKLEMGTQQTLAYQDDEGNWQLIDPPPNKQEMLARCQRYFRVYRTEAARPVYAEDCSPVMRADPIQSTLDINGITYYANSAEL